MNPRSETAEQVWAAILPEIRAVRRRRQVRRIAAAAGGVLLLGAWLAMRSGPLPEAPPVVVSVPIPAAARVAVYRVAENGSVRLEEVALQDLGTTELTFGLAPVVLDNWPQDW